MTQAPDLGSLMRRYREIAHGGDAAACREAIAGTTSQEAPFRTEGRFGRHRVVVDEPSEFGGGDTAANPAEVLFAALGTCLAVTLRCHAALRGLTLGRITAELSGNLDIRGFFDADPAVRSGFQSIAIKLSVESDAPRADLQNLLAAVDRGCPILDTVRGPTPVTLELAS